MVKNIHFKVYVHLRKLRVWSSNLKGFNEFFNIPVLLPHVLGAESDNVINELFEVTKLEFAVFRNQLSDGDLVKLSLSVSVFVIVDFPFLFLKVKFFVSLYVIDGFAVLFHDVNKL